ncbi:MAG TPA: Na+/H+ antiporter [Steroidobacteraceae bacterium]
MIEKIEVLIALMVVVAAIAVAAKRLSIPPAILLVLTGVALALFPGLPRVSFAPEFVLLLVLPPIIYSSSVAMSWREFRFNLRPISLLAVGCVVFTTIAAAAAVHWLLGLEWPVAFVLGAIVSPPDAVAPLSVARGMNLPRRILVILEGEGLANDATALVLYRFAAAAVTLGVFSLGRATLMFIAIVAGEILWGVGVGWVMLRMRRWVRHPRVEILLSLLTPFAAYLPPEQLGGSGVLATVTAGLYISWNGLRLISAATRLQGIFFWDFLIYLVEGMVFLITGLQARAVLAGVGHYSASGLLRAALQVSAVVIVARFIWIYPATYLPRWLVSSIRHKDPSPSWQVPFVISFTGVRGIVSLAAALAIPLQVANGEPFPDRDLILFLTFFVIMVTLVGQGLTLPMVIRALGLANAGRREHHADALEEFEARRQAVAAATERLTQMAAARSLPEPVVKPLLAGLHDRLNNLEHRIDGQDGQVRLVELYDDIELELITTERRTVNDLYRDGKLKDEARRRIERELDLREAALENLRAAE